MIPASTLATLAGGLPPGGLPVLIVDAVSPARLPCLDGARKPPGDTMEITLAAGRVLLRRAALAEILPLRHRELRPGRPLDAAAFDGDAEPATVHVGAFLVDPGDAVACASFMARDREGEPAYQLRGMATRADLVRRGLGSALLRYAVGVLPDGARARFLWCHARLEAVPFYLRMGWTVASERFDIPDVGPHHAMIWRPGDG